MFGWKLAQAEAQDASRYLADGLAILRKLDAGGKLTANQKSWIAIFEAALEKLAPPR